MSLDSEDIKIPLLVKLDHTLISTSLLKLGLKFYTMMAPFKKMDNSFILKLYSKLNRMIDINFTKDLIDQKILKTIEKEKKSGRDIYLYSRADELLLPKFIKNSNLFKEIFTPKESQELINNNFYIRITGEFKDTGFLLLTSGENDFSPFFDNSREDGYLVAKCRNLYSYALLKSNFFTYLSQKAISFKALYKEFLPYVKEDDLKKSLGLDTLLESFFFFWTGKVDEAKEIIKHKRKPSRPKENELIKEFIKFPIILMMIEIISTVSFNGHSEIVNISNSFQSNENIEFQNIFSGVLYLIVFPGLFGCFYYATLELISTLNPSHFKITKNCIVSNITGDRLEKTSTLFLILFTGGSILILILSLYLVSALFFVTLSIFTILTIAFFLLSSAIWKKKVLLLTRLNIAMYYYFSRLLLTDIIMKKKSSNSVTGEPSIYTVPAPMDLVQNIYLPSMDLSSLGFFC